MALLAAEGDDGSLRGDGVAENWANIDFGDGYGSPQEIVATACGRCHGSAVALEQRAAPELETWDDYSAIAFEKEIRPNDAGVLLTSTHVHSLALARMAADTPADVRIFVTSWALPSTYA